MKMKLFFIILIGVLQLVLSSCEEPFEGSSDIQGGQIVIYGRVSNLLDDTYVEIGITKNKSSKPAEVEGATIQLIDGEGGITEFCEKRLGIYAPSDIDFKGTVGEEYSIRILLPDGREYVSSKQEILTPTVIDRVNAEFVKREVIRETETSSILNFMELTIDSDFIDLEEEKFIRWDLEETFTIFQTVFPSPMPRYFTCFVNQNMSLQRLNLVSTSALSNSKIEGIYLGDRLVDYAFGVKHATEFFQRRINEEAYNYWIDIEKVSTISGSIFDNPPAPVRGNVSNSQNSDEIVLGYFEATGSTVRRFFSYGAELSEPQEDPCIFSGFRVNYASYCRNCLNHPNSSYEFERWYATDEEF